MSSAVPAAAIEARLRAAWTATPVFVANEIGEPPDPPASFVVLEFPGGAAEQITIGSPGNNLWRETGAFMIHVMVPASLGADAGPTARQYADDIAAIFRGQEFGGVSCLAPNPPQESERADGNYWGVSFGTPYRHDRLA